MLELVKAGGWVMWPILLCSVVSMAIILERFWNLRPSLVIPKDLVTGIWQLHHQGGLSELHIQSVRDGSPLGRVLAESLFNLNEPREIIKERVEDAGRHVVHDLERNLNALGTIATIAPLLGLLGSVTGLMQVFNAVTQHGVGNPQALAGGISEIMIATAAGLAVAIPSVIFYRFFQRRVDELAVVIEQEVIKFIDVTHAGAHGGRSGGGR